MLCLWSTWWGRPNWPERGTHSRKSLRSHMPWVWDQCDSSINWNICHPFSRQEYPISLKLRPKWGRQIQIRPKVQSFIRASILEYWRIIQIKRNQCVCEGMWRGFFRMAKSDSWLNLQAQGCCLATEVYTWARLCRNSVHTSCRPQQVPSPIICHARCSIKHTERLHWRSQRHRLVYY